MTTIKLADDELLSFVYGTLRPGEGNYWIEPAVSRVVEDCTTRGVMYVSSIPFVDFRTQTDTIHGTLLVMPVNHMLTRQMIGMEQGAGYIAVRIEVIDEDGDVHEAIAWHYPHTAHMNHRMYVPSGNFRDTPGSHYYQGVEMVDFDDEDDDDDDDYMDPESDEALYAAVNRKPWWME